MKELWFAEYERRVMELIDDGLTEDEAMKQADSEGSRIYNRAVDRLADRADMLRKEAKGE